MYFLLKYWKPAALVLVLSACLVSCQVQKHAAYKRGYDAATLEISGRLKDAAIKQAQTARAASADYQQVKAENQQKERIRYVEVQKIITRPVYVNRCIDDDGVRIINDSARGR